MTYASSDKSDWSDKSDGASTGGGGGADHWLVVFM